MTDNLIKILRELQNTEIGQPIPPCLRAPGDTTGWSTIDWATPLKRIAGEAADEIERFQLERNRVTRDTP